jgi:hypothetical protein
MALNQQYVRPTDTSKRLISSFARHAASLKPASPDHPGYRFEWLKLYRARHDPPSVEEYAKLDPPIPPNHPALYRVFYLGQFNADGVLQDGPKGGTESAPSDPYLYWALPIVRGRATFAVYDYARLHAGDENWILSPETNEWVDTQRGRGFMNSDQVLDPHR